MSWGRCICYVNLSNAQCSELQMISCIGIPYAAIANALPIMHGCHMLLPAAAACTSRGLEPTQRVPWLSWLANMTDCTQDYPSLYLQTNSSTVFTHPQEYNIFIMSGHVWLTHCQTYFFKLTFLQCIAS